MGNQIAGHSLAFMGLEHALMMPALTMPEASGRVARRQSTSNNLLRAVLLQEVRQLQLGGGFNVRLQA
jgi:hypothetical protein